MKNQQHLLQVRYGFDPNRWRQPVDSVVIRAEPWKGKGKRRKGKML